MVNKISQAVKDKHHMISPISETSSSKQTKEQKRIKHGNKEQTDSDQRRGRRGLTGERRGTYTKDPWTRIMEWGLSLGAGVGQGGGEPVVGRDGDNCN